MSAPPPPLLVLLPGMDGTGLMFAPFLAVLAGFEARVVRYPPDLTTYRACIDFARPHLPTDRPFLLLGESFSGPVAVALAAERPKGLMGVVLCSTFVRNPRPRLAWLAPLLRLLPPFRLPLPLLRRLLLGGRASEALSQLVTTMLPQVPPHTLKERLLAVKAVDHTSLLAQIPRPVLALVAARDRLVPQKAVAWMRAHRTQLDLATIDGPHWLLQTRPEACLQAIQRFLKLDQAGPGD